MPTPPATRERRGRSRRAAGDPAELLTEVVPRLYRVLRAALDDEPNLPSLEQLRVMARIDAGIRHASALAAARQMRVSAITPVIDALQQRGWLTRDPEADDRRRVRLGLTTAGQRALAAARERAGNQLRDVLHYGASPTTDPGLDVASVADWLGDAVRRYDDARLGDDGGLRPEAPTRSRTTGLK